MSTTPNPLKYLWSALFEDGAILNQPPDDRYSKHDDKAEWNPSSFRDLLEYQEKSPLKVFCLSDFGIILETGEFTVNTHEIVSFKLEDELLTDRKLIYYREVRQDFIDGVQQEPYVNAYVMGYEGKDTNGKVQKKTIRIT